jgi:hypothetical protein
MSAVSLNNYWVKLGFYLSKEKMGKDYLGASCLLCQYSTESEGSSVEKQLCSVGVWFNKMRKRKKLSGG